MLEHDAFHLEPFAAAEHLVEILSGELVHGDEGAVGETDAQSRICRRLWWS